MEGSLVFSKVSDISTVFVKLFVDVIVQGGQVITKLLQSLQELLGVAADLLALLGEHVHLLLLQGLALGSLLEEVLGQLQDLATLLLWVRWQQSISLTADGLKLLLKLRNASDILMFQTFNYLCLAIAPALQSCQSFVKLSQLLVEFEDFSQGLIGFIQNHKSVSENLDLGMLGIL